jgi:hypothetical protein
MASGIPGAETVIARPDGSIAISVDALTQDVALKVYEWYPFSHASYLPLVLREP